MTGNDRCLTPFSRPVRPFHALEKGLNRSDGNGSWCGSGTLRLFAASVKVTSLQTRTVRTPGHRKIDRADSYTTRWDSLGRGCCLLRCE
jgi:hypothetical protein